MKSKREKFMDKIKCKPIIPSEAFAKPEEDEVIPGTGTWLDKAKWDAMNDFRRGQMKAENDVNGSIDKAIERAASVFNEENVGKGLLDQINHPNNINLYNTFTIDEFNKYINDLPDGE